MSDKLNKRLPTIIKPMLTIEQIRGPKVSNIAPKHSGPKKLLNEPATNIKWTKSTVRPRPPLVGAVSSTGRKLDQPNMIPPIIMF